MRRVPTYAIIGAGRMARHMARYFSLLNIPYRQWARNSDQSLECVIDGCDSVLVLINDDAIEDFIQCHGCLHDKTLIHFSGRLYTSLAFGVHPLMTFKNELYALGVYQKVPFIIEDSAPVFSELFPDLKNPSFRIPAEDKNLYHALCVLGGNYTVMLWQKVFQACNERLNLPREALLPYLSQTFENIIENESLALTGPLVRGEVKTVSENLKALSGDPFQKIYQAFVDVYYEVKNESH